MTPKISIFDFTSITFKTLKDFITDKELDEEYMILLHQKNFDQLIIDHLYEYNSSMEFPFFYLGIEIDEDIYHKVGRNQIGIIESEKFNQLY
ncbi:hypothetical protein ACTS9K_08430 [Empedobacter sp. ULE_I145]|uniref:hypothetical protein n=1 Tax=Empedobacter falsenii TaxID=343874 RepID=UPI001C8D1202|nr:hypothetical protein [Empedobacter falsenii]MBY0066819.1 hypothetical protein [Empedobacter falsenii]